MMQKKTSSLTLKGESLTLGPQDKTEQQQQQQKPFYNEALAILTVSTTVFTAQHYGLKSLRLGSQMTRPNCLLNNVPIQLA